MSSGVRRVLLIGYGNPGRLDDGLGPALADALEKLHLPAWTVESNYQLTVEDAEAVAHHDVVVFADAAVAGSEPFFFRRVQPQAELSFSSHTLAPGAVMALAEQLFQARTRGYALGIRGYCFNEFGERLSEQARANLEAAVGFLEQSFHRGRFCEVGSAPEESGAAAVARSNGDQ